MNLVEKSKIIVNLIIAGLFDVDPAFSDFLYSKKDVFEKGVEQCLSYVDSDDANNHYQLVIFKELITEFELRSDNKLNIAMYASYLKLLTIKENNKYKVTK